MEKPIKPTAAQYEKEAGNIARRYAPPTYPCEKCKWPVIKGYCCEYCGDDNPSQKAK